MAPFLIFGVTFAIFLCTYDRIQLPFSNPWGIVGLLSAQEYNPLNDMIRFLFLLTAPSVVLIFFFSSRFTRELFISGIASVHSFGPATSGKWFLRFFIYLLVVAALFIACGATYRVHTLDTYHGGETLGAAIDYLSGKVPYRDTIFYHGAFRDPLRSVLAFKLFGKSIAAVRTLETILRIITMASFCAKPEA